MIGQTLSHYRITRKLGAGGMGVVYEALDLKLDRPVAIKLLPEKFAASPDWLTRFEREARLLASFSHPHIAAVHSLEEDRARHFLVLELVEGVDLAGHLARGPLPAAEALRIASQIATALEAAHEAGIVHRDLKPQNVMLTADDRVKVLDFGLAKSFSDRPDPGAGADAADSGTFLLSDTRPGVVLGSPAYMSPEQSRGEAVDRRTDIWAFGALLFEMIAGRKAFTGETVSDALAAVLTSEPSWDILPRDLHPGIVRLLRRCLRKDSHERLHDIADARIEIGEILDELAAGDEAGARPGTADGPVRGWRRPVPFWAAGLGMLAVAVVAAVLALFSDRSPAPARPIRLRTLTFSGQDCSPSASPDGRLIAFTSSRDGVYRIWLKQVQGGGEEPLTTGSDHLPRFSPDGAQVLFVRDEDGQRNLYRTPVVGGQPRKLLDDVLEADWSPDGDRVAFLRSVSTGSGNLVVLGTADVRTGRERELVRVENRLCYAVRWSPDGRHIAMNEASLIGNVADESSVDLVDPASGALQRLQLTGWNGPYTAPAWLPRGRSLLVGQAADVLAHVSGSMGQVMLYDVASRTCRPLFWSPVLVPRQGWNTSSLTILNRDQVVLDDLDSHAELREFALSGADGPPPVRVLTRGMGQDRQPAFSPDGRRVIFSSSRSGNVDLWIVERESGALRQLTDDPADDWDPAFTPDGQHVLWSSNRSGNMEIWMAAVDGSHARQVSRDGVDAENPTMTADGRWIVYSSSNDAKLGIWKIHPDGSGATRLVEGSFLLPEVSPDGRHALFSMGMVHDAIIMVVALDSGEFVPFEIDVSSNSANYQNDIFGRARWTDGGRAIIYVGQDEQRRSGIYVQDFVPGQDTSPSRRKVAGFSFEYVSESLGISPDGRHLVISARFDRQSLKLAEDVGLQW